jgi:5'-3' exonuclease
MAHKMLLDTSSLMYRAFFSMPTSVAGRDGRPVNAVYGYVDMVARLIGDHSPDEVVHVYDADWRPAPRVALYAGYKANRPPDPDGLPEQFGFLREVLDALGLPQAEAPGWEAEDAIGGLVSRAGKRDRIDIVTGDRDLIQLVKDPTVRVLFTLRGVSELRVLDESGVMSKYGVPASRYVDFAILRGDPSDGLPGVRGVGEKTARLLVDSYPDLRSLIEDAKADQRKGAPLQRSPSLRASIVDAEGYMAAMQKIVPIRLDAEMKEWARPADQTRLSELVYLYRIQGPIGRLTEALSGRV